MPFFKADRIKKIRGNSNNSRLNYNSDNTNHNLNNCAPEMNVTQSAVALNVFNSLRIPDAVKDLPNFDGNPRLLHDFLTNVEEILDFIPEVNETSYGKIILRAIRNKVIGQANEVLNMYSTPLVWNEIKQNLIVHYSDKRNETSLIHDLHQIRQNRETVDVFYSKIVEILSAMMNHVKVNETDSIVINSKQKLYEEMCLNTFLSGLREPLGSTIRAMRPVKLSDALSFCLKEQNSIYFRNPYNLHGQTFGTGNVHRNNPPQFNQQQFSTNTFAPNQNQRFSSRFHAPVRHQQYADRQQAPSNSPPTFSKQFFPNFEQRSNPRFSQNVPSTHAQKQSSYQTRNSRPEPMDIASGSTKRSSFNNNSSFLHNIDENPFRVNTTSHQPYSQSPEVTYQGEVDDVNFPILASEKQ